MSATAAATLPTNDRRLIEAGFPCHQVGAETERERGASSALPPLYFLHVWWARRPLTPSRAAVLGSLLPAGTDPEAFLRLLGIEKRIVEVSGVRWTLTGDLCEMVNTDGQGGEVLVVDRKVLNRLRKESELRQAHRELMGEITRNDPLARAGHVLRRWRDECRPFPEPFPREGARLSVARVAADPAWANERIEWEKAQKIRTKEDKYGYPRAYKQALVQPSSGLVVLDPTAGGGSIPFEALRLGHQVLANELNPVAAVILYATLDYPFRFGPALASDIGAWGERLLSAMRAEVGQFFPVGQIPHSERVLLESHLRTVPELVPPFLEETLDAFLYCRQVTCPHCGGEAPLLNSCWLAKPDDGEKWGVRIVTDSKRQSGKVLGFESYRCRGSKGPSGEDPDTSTVNDGVGTCIHCRQAIDDEEIKRQGRDDSSHGRMVDRPYCVAALRYQPKLDERGQPKRIKTGPNAGELALEKIRFFRAPNKDDLAALAAAERRLMQKWPTWEAQGLIPTERYPGGLSDRVKAYGVERWCDFFTPRQLLGHLTAIEKLMELQKEMIEHLGNDRAKAVVTYLQFMIDKGIDYNSRQTRWRPTRVVITGTFSRHDFFFRPAFCEMIYSGPKSGLAWGLLQVLDAYRGIAALLQPLRERKASLGSIKIINGTAASMREINDSVVDLVVMDPPYYDNVMYADLSDYFFVWHKRTLRYFYPDLYARRLTNKAEEAVANPARDGSREKAGQVYEKMMGEILSEIRRVLNDNGLFTIMFTHKSQDAWASLTRSIIESGWIITSSFPVASEAGQSTHQQDQAAAASSIFITCRKRALETGLPAAWTGLGGTGVQRSIRRAVSDALEEFRPLRLNPVDEMVASYGRALQVLSEAWPVMDGDAPVSPVRAMNEASAVVAASQIARLTGGRIRVEDLDTETAMALTIFGIFGHAEVAYDEALNLSRSLNIALEGRTGGYAVEEQMIGINRDTGSRGRSGGPDTQRDGYAAPLIRKGSKLRLALPEERDRRRIDYPQTDWDRLHGLLLAYRRGDVPVARAYLQDRARDAQSRILDLLDVWAAEIGDSTLKREAEELRFGLRPAAIT